MLISKVRDSATTLVKKTKDCETLQSRALAAEHRQALILKEYEILKVRVSSCAYCNQNEQIQFVARE